MPIFGVDVSKHQGSGLDWPKIRASGIDFMIARASLATTPDQQYRANVARARQAGIPVVGAYHFLYPRKVVSPTEQAQLFVERIGDADGLLTMLDVEKDRSPTTGEVWRPDIADVRAFAKEFARLTDGHRLLVYGPAWYWTGHIGNPAAADIGPLCASRYVGVTRNAEGRPIRMTPAQAFAKVPAQWWHVSHGGWKMATILQFTSSGRVAGYGGPVDLDAFRGTLVQLKALTGSAVVEPPDVPDEEAPHGAAPTHATPVEPEEPEEGPPDDDPDGAPARFYTVVPGDTLWDIAIRFDFEAEGGDPPYMVMIEAFPENERYRANPGLIHPGDRVRIR